jgi:hypothetical protein
MSEQPDSDRLERWETNHGGASALEVYLQPAETARTLIRRTIASIFPLLIGLFGLWYGSPVAWLSWIAWLDVALGVLFLLGCARTWLSGMRTRLVITIDERGITDRCWPRYPLFIPREEIEAVILYRRWSRPWVGVRVRDRDGLLAALPGWVAWCRQVGLPEGLSFAVTDRRLSWSVQKMAEVISSRYAVPVGVGPGIGGERSPEG